MNRLWHRQYDAGVPFTLMPYPQRTLLEAVNDNAAQQPHHPALRFFGKNISWRDLNRLSEEFAAALYDLGLQAGERVALILPNCPQFVICQLGAWKIGAIVTPINPVYTADDLRHALQETGATAAVVLTSSYQKVASIREQTEVRHLIAARIKTHLPRLNRLLFTLLREKKEGHWIDLVEGDLWLDQLLRRYRGHQPAVAPPHPEDPALLMFTGGTTGRPKAALSSHHALFISASQILAWFSPILDEWQDVTLLLMPLFHTYGNIGALSVGILGRQIMVVVPDPRDIDGLIKTIQTEQPAFLSGVPTLFVALENHPLVKAGQVDFSSLKLCLSGTSPLLKNTRECFQSLTGGQILEGYALTESVMALSASPVLGDAPLGSVGIPLPDVDIRIVNPETGVEVQGPGEEGEIIMAAPQMMLGYWQRPDETASTLRDGWLHTGDLGYLDENGYLFISGRLKELIKPGGFQVWPREVEEVIAAHPDVVEVGVAGVQEPLRGEVVKAWVVRKPDSKLTSAELRAFCRENLTAYKVPRRIEFREELPKSLVGKVLSRELTAQEQEQMDDAV